MAIWLRKMLMILDLGIPYSQRNVAGKWDENPLFGVMFSLRVGIHEKH